MQKEAFRYSSAPSQNPLHAASMLQMAALGSAKKLVLRLVSVVSEDTATCEREVITLGI
jgi:hypothetical protein